MNDYGIVLSYLLPLESGVAVTAPKLEAKGGWLLHLMPVFVLVIGKKSRRNTSVSKTVLHSRRIVGAYQATEGASIVTAAGAPEVPQLSQRTGVPVAQNLEGVGWIMGV